MMATQATSLLLNHMAHRADTLHLTVPDDDTNDFVDSRDETRIAVGALSTTKMTDLHDDALLAIADVLDLRCLALLSRCSKQVP